MLSEDLPLSERLEASVLQVMHEAASDEVRADLEWRLERIAGAMVSLAAADPSIILNRTIGLGLEAPATEDGVERICTRYHEHDIDRFYVSVHPEAAPASIDELLDEAGLEPDRGWMKFERGPEPAPTSASTLAVRKIGEDHVDAFGHIAASAFGLTPPAARLFRGLIYRPGFRLYMTFDGDTPAGTGLMYLQGDGAWLDWAATAPEFHRRGSQRALLARRIEDAVSAGCTRLMTATGEAVPDDPQHSYHNIEWAAFEPTYLRANWVPK